MKTLLCLRGTVRDKTYCKKDRGGGSTLNIVSDSNNVISPVVKQWPENKVGGSSPRVSTQIERSFFFLLVAGKNVLEVTNGIVMLAMPVLLGFFVNKAGVM